MTYQAKFSQLSDIQPSTAYIGMLINDQTKDVKKVLALHDLESGELGKNRQLPFTLNI